MEQINLCPKCGGKLILENGYYKCDYCDGVFDAKKQDSIEDAIKKALDEEKQEHVANIRRLLWEATHAEYLSSEAILKHARDLRTYLPDDLQACFYETANQKNEKLINDFLNQIDVEDNYYIMDVIIDYMIKTMDKANFLVVSNLIEKTYAKKDLNLYNDFVSRASDMMNKIDSGTYDLNLERDCFIAYSSKDIDKVMELVYKLENSGLSCFVALRNLRHGKGAVENYEDAIKKAIDNTKVLVFVSSVNSRSQACDAFKFELPYIKTKDIQNAPAEYRFDYEKIPDKYKKPRVQYLIDPVSNTPNDRIIQQIMGKKEWRYDADQVCSSVINLINNPVIDEDEEKNKISDALKELEDLKKEIAKQNKQAKIVNGVDINARLEYCEILIADKKYEKAEKTIDEEVLKNDPKNPRAYILLTVIDFRLTKEEELATLRTSLTNNSNFNKALSFATGSYLEIVKGYNEAVLKNIKYDKDLAIFNQAMKLEDNKEYDKAISLFNTIKDFEGVKEEIEKCKYLLFELNTNKYNEANKYLEKYEYAKAIALFKELGDFQDSKERLLQATELQKKEQIYQKALIDTKGKDIGVFKNAISKLETIIDYRNSKELIEKYNNCILKLEKEKKKKKRNTLIFSLVSITAICICVIVAIYYVRVVVPTNNYNEAVSLMEQGRYNEARALFGEMGSFSDAKAQMDVVDAYEAFDNGDYESGIDHIYNAGGTINISYDADGGDIETSTQTIRKLSYVNNTVNKAGYTFYGWTITTYSIDNTKDKISCDLSLKASYDLISYNIIYNLNGGMVSGALISTYTITEEVNLATPTKKGYTFVGWKEEKSNEFIHNNVISAGNYGTIELDAIYSPNEYIITFDVNGGTLNQATMKVIYDSAIEFPTPSFDNFIFVGWYIENVEFTNGSIWNLDHNATVKAEWTDKIYQISYDLDGGTANNKDNYIFKDTFSLSYPEKKGYDFVGWTGTGLNEVTKDVVIPVGSSGDRSYVAHYTPTIYSIDYVLNNGTSTNKTTYTIEDEFVLSSPTKDGYTFTGWTNTSISTPTKDVKINLGTTGNLTFTANYEANTYEISYDANGGAISKNKQNAIYDKNITLITPTRDYYNFAGWYLNDEKIDNTFKYSYANNINLVASWTPINYTITYYLNDGVNNEANPSTYNITSLDINLLSPTKEGKDFFGWFGNSSFTGDMITTIPSGSHGNIRLYACYGNSVAFNTNGGNKIENIVYRYNTNVTLPTPTKDDYLFYGWYYNDKKVENGTWNFDERVTLNALWSSKLSDFTFELVSNNYVVKSYSGSEDKIYIPFEYNGILVTTIGQNCFYNKANIKEIIIPNTITAIENSAFYGCSSLEGIQIPDSVTSISHSVFRNCTSLKEVVIPNTVNSIGTSSLFQDCRSLESVSLPNTITSIGYYMFKNCTSLKDITIPSSVQSISDYAFMNASSLESLVIPNTVLTIGAYGAFMGCSSLKSITLPDNITYIGNYMLEDCSSLLEIVIPDKVTDIYERAFNNCTSLLKVTIGSGVKNIYKKDPLPGSTMAQSFAGCNNIVEVINKSTMSVSVYFPNAKQIVSKASDSKLSKNIDGYYLYNYPGNNAQFIAYVGSSNKLVIPEGVSIIDCRFIYNEDRIISCVIPSTFDHFLNKSDNVFKNDCYKIVEVVNKSAIDLDYCFPNAKQIINNVNQTKLSEQDDFVLYTDNEHTYLVDYIGSEEEVVIPDNVYYINDNAFRKNDSVKKVTIPASVKTIGKYAFYYCSQLEEVNLTSGLLEIGAYAFNYCTNLSSITLPEGLEEIGQMAFAQCSSLPKMVLPSSLEAIGRRAFRDCSNEIYNSYEDGLYLGTTNNPYKWLMKTSSLTITTLSVHNDCKIIDMAFYDCNKLASVSLPSGLEKIGDYAFYNCSSLTAIEIPNNVTYIGDYAFYNCNKLDNVIIPSGITKLGERTFYGCASLTSINIPNSVLEIGPYAFSDCSSIENITLPTNITKIDSYLFSNCTSLTEITIPNSVTTINSNAFYKTSIRNITIPSSVTKLGNIVFPSTLESIVIEGNISEFGSAFYSCSALTNITFSSDVTSIPKGLLKQATKVEKLTIPFIGGSRTENKYLGYIFDADSYTKNGSAIPSSLKEVVLLDGITSIGVTEFNNCKYLTDITIPNSVTMIFEGALFGCSSLSKLSIPFVGDKEHLSTDTYQYPFGYLFGTTTYDGAKKTTQMYYGESTSIKTSTDYYIPSSLKEVNLSGSSYITNGAFYGCDELETIRIPASITSIAHSAFYGCTSLNKVVISDLIAWCNISFENPTANPLYYAHSLYIGNSLLTHPLIQGVNAIKDYAFINFTSMEGLMIIGNVSSIGAQAFSGCTSLSSVQISTYEIREIGNYAFNGCSSLTEISLPNGVESIGTYAFNGCSNLASITLPNSLISIDEWAFNECSSLDSINLPDGLTTINRYAFRLCTSLTSVTLPTSITSLPTGLFYGCENLETIIIPNNVTSIGDSVFKECSSLASVTIPSGVAVIGISLFDGCTNLENVEIPNSITTIGVYAFRGCTNLSTIVIPENATYFNNSFDNSPATIYYCSVRTYNDNEYHLIWSIPSEFEKTTDNIPAGLENSYLPILTRELYRFNGWKDSSDNYVTNGNGLIDTSYLNSSEINLVPAYEKYNINPSISNTHYTFDVDALNAYKNVGYTKVRVTISVNDLFVAGYLQDITLQFRYDIGESASTYFSVSIHGDDTGEIEPGEGDIYLYNGSNYFDITLNDLINNLSHMLTIERADYYYSSFPVSTSFTTIE